MLSYMEKGERRVKFSKMWAALNVWLGIVAAILISGSAEDQNPHLTVTFGR